MKDTDLRILFFDIGGILLTNGWGHESRILASEKFDLDYNEVNSLHNFIFNIYEIGKISLDEYLDLVIFNHPREFSRDEFKNFMYAQSAELPQMLQWLKNWKRDCKFRIISINNEGKELNEYRIKKFHLHECFDAFISSCEVKMRKPDPGIFRLALGIAQAAPEQCIYFDDRIMFVNLAQGLGIKSFQHISFENTKSILESL
ncbi:HAD family hydrolase [Pedobacter immunditicola]|uniref:HAD family hydrolase n=1 Tax=Pedobacter immunditicola TaxID=3133440 RepID=UPI00309BD9D9